MVNLIISLFKTNERKGDGMKKLGRPTWELKKLGSQRPRKPCPVKQKGKVVEVKF